MCIRVNQRKKKFNEILCISFSAEMAENISSHTKRHNLEYYQNAHAFFLNLKCHQELEVKNLYENRMSFLCIKI